MKNQTKKQPPVVGKITFGPRTLNPLRCRVDLVSASEAIAQVCGVSTDDATVHLIFKAGTTRQKRALAADDLCAVLSDYLDELRAAIKYGSVDNYPDTANLETARRRVFDLAAGRGLDLDALLNGE